MPWAKFGQEIAQDAAKVLAAEAAAVLDGYSEPNDPLIQKDYSGFDGLKCWFCSYKCYSVAYFKTHIVSSHRARNGEPLNEDLINDTIEYILENQKEMIEDKGKGTGKKSAPKQI